MSVFRSGEAYIRWRRWVRVTLDWQQQSWLVNYRTRAGWFIGRRLSLGSPSVQRLLCVLDGMDAAGQMVSDRDQDWAVRYREVGDWRRR